jgi:hypothetical protein
MVSAGDNNELIPAWITKQVATIGWSRKRSGRLRIARFENSSQIPRIDTQVAIALGLSIKLNKESATVSHFVNA